MALDNVEDWVTRANDAVRDALEGFVERRAYEAGDNFIRLAGDAAIEWSTDLPHDVVDFFKTVDEVSWPDIWNGYFLGPAREIVRCFSEGDPAVVLVGSERRRVVVVGSDGGGSYFVLDIDAGGTILRVEEAFVRDGILHGISHPVAPDLRSFLEALLENVDVAGREGVPAF